MVRALFGNCNNIFWVVVILTQNSRESLQTLLGMTANLCREFPQPFFSQISGRFFRVLITSDQENDIFNGGSIQWKNDAERHSHFNCRPGCCKRPSCKKKPVRKCCVLQHFASVWLVNICMRAIYCKIKINCF